MLIFSLEFPTSGLGFPQHPRGPLSQGPTKQVVIWGWHFFLEARACHFGFHNTHGLLSPCHTKTGCAPCPFDRVRVCACAYFGYWSIWLPITWVITCPPTEQALG